MLPKIWAGFLGYYSDPRALSIGPHLSQKRRYSFSAHSSFYTTIGANFLASGQGAARVPAPRIAMADMVSIEDAIVTPCKG